MSTTGWCKIEHAQIFSSPRIILLADRLDFMILFPFRHVRFNFLGFFFLFFLFKDWVLQCSLPHSFPWRSDFPWNSRRQLHKYLIFLGNRPLQTKVTHIYILKLGFHNRRNWNSFNINLILNTCNLSNYVFYVTAELKIKHNGNVPIYNHTLATILVEYASAVSIAEPLFW